MDAQTGATVWRRDRLIDYGSDDGDFRKAYGTCAVIQLNGRPQLISPSAAETIAYDPRTGDELWRYRHGGMNTATRPLYAHGLIYLTTGDAVGPQKSSLLAVRPPGQDKPSPALLGLGAGSGRSQALITHNGGRTVVLGE